MYTSCNSSNLEGAFHYDDCYFCMVYITSNKKAKDRRNTAYSSTSLSVAPIPHGEGLSVPNTPVVSLSEEESVSLNACDNEDILQPNASKELHMCNQ